MNEEERSMLIKKLELADAIKAMADILYKREYVAKGPHLRI